MRSEETLTQGGEPILYRRGQIPSNERKLADVLRHFRSLRSSQHHCLDEIRMIRGEHTRENIPERVTQEHDRSLTECPNAQRHIFG